MGTALVITDQVPARRTPAQRTAALEQDLQRATARDQRKDEFLATLAHELRNQLAPALNALEVMKQAGTNPDLFERARATLERQALHLKRLLDDTLDLSRIAHHRLELRRERIDLGELLEQAMADAQCAFEAAGHTLAITRPEQPVFLEADSLRLAQVFANLLTNACKYTNRGGRIAIGVELQGSDVLVRVSDNGIGIPADLLASVFEPFVRLGPAQDRTSGGLGLGLGLARRLVEQHGGTLTARSAGSGRGSEFMVRLPILTQQPLVRSPTPLLPRPAPVSLPRLLLVDDSLDAVESLAALLSQAGYEVRTAHDGVSALAEAAAYRPDVILLDIGLPGLSGLDVCRTIRAEPWGKGMLVIALTGWGQHDDRLRTSQAGFDGHLLKPVDYAVLTKLLDAVGDAACPLFV